MMLPGDAVPMNPEYVHECDGDGETVDTRECWAMRLLADNGWTANELKMTMQVGHLETVRRHVDGECSHSDLPGDVR